jgi:hypothetical protein
MCALEVMLLSLGDMCSRGDAYLEVMRALGVIRALSR